MSRDVEAIETVYRGITYRSRLEATWAAMFDLMEWEWSYECDPIGGWLPDFVVKTKYPADRVYVEVKPFLDLNDEAAKDGRSQIYRPKLRQGDPEALLLGRGPLHHEETDLMRIGWLYRWTQFDDGTSGMFFGMAFPVLTRTLNGFPIGLISEYGDEGPRTELEIRDVLVSAAVATRGAAG